MDRNLFNYDTILPTCGEDVKVHVSSPSEKGECDTHTPLHEIGLITSYHAYSRKGDISISTTNPQFTKATEFFEKLTPSAVMGMRNKYAFLNMSEEEYTDRFFNGLEKMDARAIYEELQAVALCDVPVIVCFEKWDKPCHRNMVAQWIYEKLGVKFMERYAIEKGKELVLNTQSYKWEEVK